MKLLMTKDKSCITIALLVVILCIGAVTPALASQPIGGNQGWYAVNCNVDGAQVYFDGTYKGDIQGGVLNVPVFTTGTPYKAYTVQKEGYTTFSDSIDAFPAKGQTIDLYATLNPTQPTQPAQVGGDIGWYVVNCNVNGATVMFDNEVKGTINQGTLTVQVYVTGTPYKTYAVSMPGYTTFSAPITQYPAQGESVNLYATLNPSPQTTTKAPISMFTVFLGLAGAVLALGIFHKKE